MALTTRHHSAILAVATAITIWLPGMGATVPASADPAANDGLPMMEMEPVLDPGPNTAAGQHPPPLDTDEPLKAKAVVVDVKSDTLNYDTNRRVYIATGSVHVVISEQNSELFADKVIYDQSQDLLIADGHVIIFKNGQRTEGSYAKIDLTRESALINDIATKVDTVRITAKQSMVGKDVHIFEDGKLVVQDLMARIGGRKPSSYDDDIAFRNNDQDKDTPESGGQPVATSLSPEEGGYKLSKVATANAPDDTAFPSEDMVVLGQNAAADMDSGFFTIHAKEIDIHRWSDGYSKVDMKWPQLKVGPLTVGMMPSAQFSMDDAAQNMEYLGPDIGFDPDYGGFYAGPGWDFRVGDHGSIRFSPLLSYGGGARRGARGSSFKQVEWGPGIGGVVHYRDPLTSVDLAYSSKTEQPLLLAERKLFRDRNTRIRLSANEEYNSGFFGYERPRYGAMISDNQVIGDWHNIRLETYESIGAYKDEFFPTNDATFFVEAEEGAEPIYAGRAQLQARIRNATPVFSLGEYIDFGYRGIVAMSAYTTGDFYGMIRGGPNIELNLMNNRFRTRLQYDYALLGGESPFIFDTYYKGRNSVQLRTAFDINEYLTVGTRTDLSLERDNARNALLTGNRLYMLVGPQSIKFNIAYDVIRQRSYFGVNFYPGQGDKPIYYDRLRIFESDQYDPQAIAPKS